MPTIALVDDDRNILTSVSIALEAEGYRIMTYTDGASALEGFKTSPPDLAILDIKMPIMDGLAAAEKIAGARIAPVVILTAFSQRELVERLPEDQVPVRFPRSASAWLRLRSGRGRWRSSARVAPVAVSSRTRSVWVPPTSTPRR